MKDFKLSKKISSIYLEALFSKNYIFLSSKNEFSDIKINLINKPLHHYIYKREHDLITKTNYCVCHNLFYLLNKIRDKDLKDINREESFIELDKILFILDKNYNIGYLDNYLIKCKSDFDFIRKTCKSKNYLHSMVVFKKNNNTLKGCLECLDLNSL